jgi:hypothetical protein
MTIENKEIYKKPALIHYGSIKDVTRAAGEETPDNKQDPNSYSGGGGGYDENQ